MSYYYPTQPSYQPQPVVYTSSHRSHSYSPSAAYYPTTHPGTYGGNNVVYIPSHSSSSRHRHGTTIMPSTAGAQVITVPVRLPPALTELDTDHCTSRAVAMGIVITVAIMAAVTTTLPTISPLANASPVSSALVGRVTR
ncbi:hypothetical protein IW262DRAFT_1453762 [Armillaria fumosa]|nr:hypothetical protein IW262DRAFT_1453762 [Armillaria fumosa]